MTSKITSDVIVVGAGLSGLIAAKLLKETGKTVTILDKGSSVGGRLATQHVGNGIADYGAQFFTARTDEFKQEVQQWLDDDLLAIWGHGWSDGSLKRSTNDGQPRYVAKKGMNALAKYLADSISTIHVDTKVSSLSWQDDIWTVSDFRGQIYQSKVLVMTPPVPQTLALIEDIALLPQERVALEHIHYAPCLCGLFVIDGGIDLPEPGALQNFDNFVYWFGDNQKKGISPNEHIITMHANAIYSRKHYDDSDNNILYSLRTELQHYLTKGTSITEQHLKKWRYSIPLTTHPEDVLTAQHLPIIFAGDAFGGRGRVEGAYLSGLKAGQVAIEML
ncbi:MAG: FAD-dependent oxidoreductase [Phototrophicaceae bacterium]